MSASAIQETEPSYKYHVPSTGAQSLSRQLRFRRIRTHIRDDLKDGWRGRFAFLGRQPADRNVYGNEIQKNCSSTLPSFRPASCQSEQTGGPRYP